LEPTLIYPPKAQCLGNWPPLTSPVFDGLTDKLVQVDASVQEDAAAQVDVEEERDLTIQRAYVLCDEAVQEDFCE
jgi:hypothetical protein